MFMRLILLPCLTGVCLICQGQTITNLSAIQQGNEVVVTYQLDGEKGKAYAVTVYASYNNFTKPLQFVLGDVTPKRVLPGTNKTIRWQVLDELKNFDGNIAFEIRAVVEPPLFSKITTSATKVKRGKEIKITWTGGFPQDQVMVELIKGDKRVPAGTLPNHGSVLFAVPKKMKTGKYNIQLSQAGEWTGGDGFVVKPKVPMVLKALPALVAGAVIVFWPAPDPPFPSPPDLTGN